MSDVLTMGKWERISKTECPEWTKIPSVFLGGPYFGSSNVVALGFGLERGLLYIFSCATKHWPGPSIWRGDLWKEQILWIFTVIPTVQLGFLQDLLGGAALSKYDSADQDQQKATHQHFLDSDIISYHIISYHRSI